MNPFFDALETRDPAAREAALLAALPGQVAQAQRGSPAMAELLDGIDAATITSRAALARLPVLRKHELLERQKARRAADPFGGYSAIGWRGVASGRGARRVYQSPGPIYEPEGTAGDYWRMARAIYAAGFREGDLAHCSFSYHLTPAGAMMEAGAHAVGCTTFAGGIGNTELQLQAVADLKPHGYIGTPSFLKILVEKAGEHGVGIGSLHKAMVGGEAFPPSLRDWLSERGVEAFQSYATADAGLIAYETSAREGLVLDESVILEIVRPGTGEPVNDGEVGEVVVTVLNPDYPLVRFGTGDLSAVLAGACPSGRTNIRIKGWLGRADQTAKVRGMFVHPSQVAEIVRRHPEVVRARLVVSGEMANDRMTLRAEVANAPDGLAAAIATSIRDITKLRGEVEFSPPGALPNDGKVIEDARSYN
ncbi:AMP-binding protein [Aquincola sp. S2]|uniref:AMP-binding protein n=1 Tax=Pseudaquabacterium terrae TaxID=2732868 RepID=A0ABX2EBN9_9BURK|nr:AMP-binding protein [Aquabacterium terrae]NRF66561.1 AMP-binding protein [Aquabacterium terrae]